MNMQEYNSPTISEKRNFSPAPSANAFKIEHEKTEFGERSD